MRIAPIPSIVARDLRGFVEDGEAMTVVVGYDPDRIPSRYTYTGRLGTDILLELLCGHEDIRTTVRRITVERSALVGRTLAMWMSDDSLHAEGQGGLVPPLGELERGRWFTAESGAGLTLAAREPRS